MVKVIAQVFHIDLWKTIVILYLIYRIFSITFLIFNLQHLGDSKVGIFKQ